MFNVFVMFTDASGSTVGSPCPVVKYSPDDPSVEFYVEEEDQGVMASPLTDAEVAKVIQELLNGAFNSQYVSDIQIKRIATDV